MLLNVVDSTAGGCRGQERSVARLKKIHFHEGREDTKTQKRKSKRVFSAISAISAVKIFSEIFAQNDSFARKTLSKAPYRWGDVFFSRDL